MVSGSACPACGGPLGEARPVPAAEPALRAVPFALRRCARCGTAVTVGDPPPEPHETGAYRPGPPRLYRLAQPVLKTFDRQRLALLRPFAPPPARLLDAGAGKGRFVLAATAAGYEATGIEPSERGIAVARASGAPVTRATIASADVPAGSLDAVTLWHVLEHLEDPEAALRSIGGWLRPGGILLVGVPNLDSVQARLGGDRWYHLDVPRHRIHFTQAGIRALLQRTGFEPLGTTHVLAEHNPFGMWQSLANRLTRDPSYVYNLLKRNAPVRSRDLVISAAALAMLPLAVIAELLAGLARRGGTVAVVARAGSPTPPPG